MRSDNSLCGRKKKGHRKRQHRYHINAEEVLELYKANAPSSAEKPDELMAALRNSHSLVTARIAGGLVGLGNEISESFGFVRAGKTEPLRIYAGIEH